MRIFCLRAQTTNTPLNEQFTTYTVNSIYTYHISIKWYLHPSYILKCGIVWKQVGCWRTCVSVSLFKWAVSNMLTWDSEMLAQTEMKKKVSLFKWFSHYHIFTWFDNLDQSFIIFKNVLKIFFLFDRPRLHV